jgi:hypothetical protein
VYSCYYCKIVVMIERLLDVYCCNFYKIVIVKLGDWKLCSWDCKLVILL